MMDVALGFFLGSLFGLGLGLQLCRWKFGEENGINERSG